MPRTEIRKSFIIRMRGDEAVRILMVEDEVPIREGVCDYLSECNYEMIAAIAEKEWIRSARVYSKKKFNPCTNVNRF